MQHNLTKKKSFSSHLQLLIIALCSICPIVIILGNILPPLGGYKLHWFYNGGIFLLVSILLVFSIHRWIFSALIFFLFVVLNFLFSIEFRLTELINILAGPLVFFATLLSLENGLVRITRIKIFMKIFILASFIPVNIALLQFAGILPMTILSFDYVNVTKWNGLIIERVNGYLFHGSELANIGYLLFATLAVLVKRVNIIFLFLFFLIFQMIVFIKTSIVGTIILFLYLFFAKYKYRNKLKRILVCITILCILILVGIYYETLAEVLADALLSTKKGMLFNPDIFTGRGRMWTIFLFSIGVHFDTMNYLFGGGFGVSKFLFEYGINFSKVKWVYEYIPHAHNEILNTFINGGVVLIVIYFFLFRKASILLSKLNITSFRLIPIVLIIFMTSGITIPIFDRFIFWIGLTFLLLIIVSKSNILMKRLEQNI